MEVNQPSPSVIARLMGFDDAPTWQPVQKKAKVLSEEYFQRVASIGIRQDCPVPHSFTVTMLEQEEYGYVFKALEALKRDKHPRKLSRKREEHKPLKVDYQTSENLLRHSHRLACSISANYDVSKHIPCDLKLRQKMPGYCRGREIPLVSSVSKCLPSRKIAVLKPSEGRTEDAAKSFPWWSNYPDSFCSYKAKLQLKERVNSGSSTKTVKQRSRFSKQSLRTSGDSANRVSINAVTDSKLEVPTTGAWDNVSSGRGSVFPCQALQAPFQQDISNGIAEEEHLSLYHSISDPESPISLEGNYQPCPSSALEPVPKKESLVSSVYPESASGCSNGVEMQVELQYSEMSEACSEAYSEGSCIVSGDEDDGKESFCDSEENGDQMIASKILESQDFSYLVDLLSEAGFHRQNLQMDPDSGAISSSVFENLEKKYGKQTLWKRSERKLLFDRINSELIDMLQPSTGIAAWTKSVGSRFRHSQGQKKIEDELWLLLVCLENEASWGLDKVLGSDGKWMDLRENIEGIGKEIENSLMVELVEDAVRQLV